MKNDRSLETVERNHILNVLVENNFNRTHTSKVLKIGIRTLQRKLIRWNLSNVFNKDDLEENLNNFNNKDAQ